MREDTIAAIATPLGESGVAIIRVSGADSIPIVQSMFRSKRKLTTAASHTVHYGHLYAPKSGERLEEALVTIMRAPRSYTAEDVAEVSCHGGLVSVRRVLNVLLEQGARLAEPGEFTKRAFLNGRLDLTQAEAVMDLIRSKSDRAFSVALRQADGQLSGKVKSLRRVLLETMAHIEVNIDYPEHDVEQLTNTFIKEKCESALRSIDGMLHTAEQGKMLREGIETAIVGKPNVGKSSLLNALARDNRAIVTDIPGTTRDVIEEYVILGGIPLKLLDTAGIRETVDVVEKIGVERSRNAMAAADLILFVLDGTRPLADEERVLLNGMEGRQVIAVVNKSDLDTVVDVRELRDMLGAARVVHVSARESSGIEQLEKALGELFFQGAVDSADLTYVSNARHIHLLKQARDALAEAMEGVASRTPIDMIQIDIRNAWELLGEMIGDSASESLIDQIFSQFCLGK